MSSNNTNATEVREYTCVRFYVSTVSFSVLLFFNLIINWTIMREDSLRCHARFVLLFQLLVSALLYLGTSSIFYYQIYLDARPGRAACLTVITILISSASNILLTLTLMAMDRLCAVCHPMRYNSLCTRGPWFWPWLLGFFTWALALLIPFSLLLQSDFHLAGEAYHGECGREQLKTGELQKVLFIGVCTLLILYSYVRILVEEWRMGVLNRRNRAGWRTIVLHGTQLAVYILPNFVNFGLTSLYQRELIQRSTKELFALISFTFFSLAQCVAPVVYGLRKEELKEEVGRRFPCFCRYMKTLLGWTVRANCTHMQRTSREQSSRQTINSSGVPEETRPMELRSSSHDSHSCRVDDA